MYCKKLNIGLRKAWPAGTLFLIQPSLVSFCISRFQALTHIACLTQCMWPMGFAYSNTAVITTWQTLYEDHHLEAGAQQWVPAGLPKKRVLLQDTPATPVLTSLSYMDAYSAPIHTLLILSPVQSLFCPLTKKGQKEKKKKNIQQPGFAGGHPPNY